MRLAHKLSLVQFVLIVAVLTVHAVIQFDREVHLFESGMRREQHVTGEFLRAAMTEIWELYGPERALKLIDEANSAEQSVHITWVWQQGLAADTTGNNKDEEWARRVLRGESVAHIDQSSPGPGNLSSYFPIAIKSVQRGAVRVSETLAQERRFVHATVLHTVVTTTAIGLGAILISFVVGSSFIVKPMRLLVGQARRIGAGDLSTRLQVNPRDEIGELAAEMNVMSDQLERAMARISAETRARISALEQLRHADRLATVGTLSSGIAHELGTPLNVVSGRAKMIETAGGNGDESASNARIIREQAERMTRIIRQLLDFSRRGSQEKKPSDVKTLAMQVLTLLRPMAEKRSVRLRLDADSPASFTAVIDPDQIKQVLTNLVLNGIQAMPQGGDLTVRLEYEAAAGADEVGTGERGYVCMVVEDKGCGIPGSSLPRIFDPFYTTKGVGEGTGLGLSVSYSIVQEHGGWIQVESELHKGSRFKVYLPAAEGVCAEKS